MDIIETLSKELGINKGQIERTVALIDEGNTIPFIARYRKEVTGSLDDTTLRNLFDRLEYLRKLDARRDEVRAAIEAQDKLTPEIESALAAAVTLVEIEDIYRPYRQQRKTRASVARARGLEPLALLLLECRREYSPSIEEAAAQYIDAEKEVNSVEEALAGAKDIVAELVSSNAEYRKFIRALTYAEGTLNACAAKDEDSVYSMYYEYSEPLSRVRSHRVLAINRGEKEEFLKVTVTAPVDTILGRLYGEIITDGESPAASYLREAVDDAYDRLISPSVEREIRSDMFDNASEGAIKVFSENLRALLMQPPLRGKVVLGYDPGYRTGCKLAVVDATGKVIDTAVIFPTKPAMKTEESRKKVIDLIRKYKVDVVAIGNGTASRESEIFIADTIKAIPEEVKYIIVSEAGASVYSASKLAADEFPDYDVCERSAVSIARRLQDPLAELVKIDPKSIGVGQYQHDMKEQRLDGALSGVVEGCVNGVGVELNTASHSLLSYIAGINATCAKNIVKYRESHGRFKSRAELTKVPRLGDRAFEQCAGFLRVSGSDEILDNTGVHPESYEIARRLLENFGYAEDDVRQNRIYGLKKKLDEKTLSSLCEKLSCGAPTLLDIADELEKPGRDIRSDLPMPELRSDVMSIEDLKEGMMIKGTVRNVVDFGAFVDIGVHQDGLLHISEMADKFIKTPSEAVSLGDIITVRIKSVDLVKGRIALSMRAKRDGEEVKG